MENQFNVESSSATTTQEHRNSFPVFDPNRPTRSWQFANDFQQLMGDDSEPDPLFFVESWTLGAAVAVENLKQRRHIQNDRMPQTQVFGQSDQLNAEFFVQEGQKIGVQFCSSRYATWPASNVEGPSTQAQSKVAERSEAFAGAYDYSQPTIQPMTRQDAFQTLEITSASTRGQIKAAYRRLVNEWHPDRFEWGTEKLRRLATEKMAAINKAYRLLRSGI